MERVNKSIKMKMWLNINIYYIIILNVKKNLNPKSSEALFNLLNKYIKLSLQHLNNSLLCIDPNLDRRIYISKKVNT